MDIPLLDWRVSYLGIGLLCFLISAGTTRLLIWLAPLVGLLDHPSGVKFHRAPIPVGGGLAILVSLLPLLAFESTRGWPTGLILMGSCPLAAIGLIDDLRGVSAVFKFLVLVGLTIILWRSGIAATTTRVAAIDFVITVLWITGISSAFNSIDNMDGLSTGVAAIAACGFLIIAVQTEQWVLGGLAVALLGGSLGFLVFNFSPARIFMGDTGSFFLGFFLSTLGVVGEWNENQVIAAIIPVLLLGLPLFDLTFTVIRRHQSGVTASLVEAIRHCDTDHLSHRLVRLGLPVRTAVKLLYSIAASFVISAISLRTASPLQGFLALLQAGLIVSAFVAVLLAAGDGPASKPVPAAGGTAGAASEARRLRRWLGALLALSFIAAVLRR